jgi:hypothetical protein
VTVNRDRLLPMTLFDRAIPLSRAAITLRLTKSSFLLDPGHAALHTEVGREPRPDPAMEPAATAPRRVSIMPVISTSAARAQKGQVP